MSGLTEIEVFHGVAWGAWEAEASYPIRNIAGHVPDGVQEQSWKSIATTYNARLESVLAKGVEDNPGFRGLMQRVDV